MEKQTTTHIIVGVDQNSAADILKVTVTCTDEQYFDQADLDAIRKVAKERGWQKYVIFFDDCNQHFQMLDENTSWLPTFSIDISGES